MLCTFLSTFSERARVRQPPPQTLLPVIPMLPAISPRVTWSERRSRRSRVRPPARKLCACAWTWVTVVQRVMRKTSRPACCQSSFTAVQLDFTTPTRVSWGSQQFLSSMISRARFKSWFWLLTVKWPPVFFLFLFCFCYMFVFVLLTK